jgi:hypothetical protein
MAEHMMTSGTGGVDGMLAGGLDGACAAALAAAEATTHA